MQFDRVIEGEKIAPLRHAMDELRRYLTGERVQFTCPLDLHGTAFQVEVWEELYRIPYGETRTYTEIAQAIGRPAAVRAVGAANGANPVAIIVPCHRVIGSNGTLTGYGGGLPTKAWLLLLEGIGTLRGKDLAPWGVGVPLHFLEFINVRIVDDLAPARGATTFHSSLARVL